MEAEAQRKAVALVAFMAAFCLLGVAMPVYARGILLANAFLWGLMALIGWARWGRG